ncbi:MAG: hypothetical protein J0H69_22545 [Burkholderiales bacterium]|nr:hypothetical protein [Burkholderiales bacterium]
MNAADLPAFEAQWWPVRLEMVPGSGEALTIAVIVRAASGQASIRQAIPPSTLSNLFGTSGKGMVLVVGHTVLEVRKQLDAAVSVEQVELPFGGVTLGAPRDCIARDLNEIFGIALRLSSAFAIPEFGAAAETPESEARRAFDEWADKVQVGVMVAAHLDSLRNAFNVQFPLAHRKKTRVGFVYGGYVAQFGVLRPGKSVSADVRALKLKLFDLDVLRRERALQFNKAEILVGYQDAGDNYTSRQRESLRESWEFVAAEARARSVRARRFDTAQSAAAYLAEQAIAN